MHSTSASKSLIKMLNRTSPRNESWGTLLVTVCQPDAASFIMALWAPPFSHIITSKVSPAHYRLISQSDNLSRRVLWGIISKAFLKCKKITTTAFPLSNEWVNYWVISHVQVWSVMLHLCLWVYICMRNMYFELADSPSLKWIFKL